MTFTWKPLQQEHFGRSPSPSIELDSGREYTRLVQHQQVAFMQQVRHITHVAMFWSAAATINEQARAIARLNGYLSNTLLRQLVIKVS